MGRMSDADIELGHLTFGTGVEELAARGAAPVVLQDALRWLALNALTTPGLFSTPSRHEARGLRRHVAGLRAAYERGERPLRGRDALVDPRAAAELVVEWLLELPERLAERCGENLPSLAAAPSSAAVDPPAAARIPLLRAWLRSAPPPCVEALFPLAEVLHHAWLNEPDRAIAGAELSARLAPVLLGERVAGRAGEPGGAAPGRTSSDLRAELHAELRAPPGGRRRRSAVSPAPWPLAPWPGADPREVVLLMLSDYRVAFTVPSDARRYERDLARGLAGERTGPGPAPLRTPGPCAAALAEALSLRSAKSWGRDDGGSTPTRPETGPACFSPDAPTARPTPSPATSSPAPAQLAPPSLSPATPAHPSPSPSPAPRQSPFDVTADGGDAAAATSPAEAHVGALLADQLLDELLSSVTSRALLLDEDGEGSDPAGAAPRAPAQPRPRADPTRPDEPQLGRASAPQPAAAHPASLSVAPPTRSASWPSSEEASESGQSTPLETPSLGSSPTDALEQLAAALGRVAGAHLDAALVGQGPVAGCPPHLGRVL